MILKSIEICELNTDIANESTIKNFKEPSFYLFIYLVRRLNVSIYMVVITWICFG